MAQIYISAVQNQGYLHQLDGELRANNPYDHEDARHADWDLGWLEGREEDGNSHLRNYVGN